MFQNVNCKPSPDEIFVTSHHFVMDGSHINMGNKDKILPYCRIYYESLHLYCTERCAISPEIKFRRQNSGIVTDSNLDNCEFKH